MGPRDVDLRGLFSFSNLEDDDERDGSLREVETGVMDLVVVVVVFTAAFVTPARRVDMVGE